MTDRLRIAAFGFRHLPPRSGGAGADKFALELLPRLARRGHQVTAYNRIYPGDCTEEGDYKCVKRVNFSTTERSGFDTLLHSARSTAHIIWYNTADVVHIQNGGNSIFALVLRLFGKRTYLSQDGADWVRDKWPWYAKLFLRASASLSARVHNEVIFDNVFARADFEKKFKRHYSFIPFGSDVDTDGLGRETLEELGLEPGSYYLFVGRFIPDKGLHWLVQAFKQLKTERKLVLVGGSPNPSSYCQKLCAEAQVPNILLPGFLYGRQVHELMRHARAYIQPSAIEGLSPVILEAAYLGAPILSSDIPQNRFIMKDNAVYFRASDSDDLHRALKWCETEHALLAVKASAGTAHVKATYSWDAVTAAHEAIFMGRAVDFQLT